MASRFFKIGLISLLISGCYKVQYRNETEEPGTVETIQFIPYNSSLSPGFSSSGKFVATFNHTPEHKIVIINSPSSGNLTFENEALFHLVKLQERVRLLWTERWLIYNDHEVFSRKVLKQICLSDNCIGVE